MIYAKHAQTIFDDFPGKSMEYNLKVRHSCESRNPEGPILGGVRLMKQAPRVAPTGDGWGGGRRTGSSVWAGGSRTAPTVQIRRCGMMGKGNHKGCPYGGWMGWWLSNPFVSVGGRFPNRPYGKSGVGSG